MRAFYTYSHTVPLAREREQAVDHLRAIDGRTLRRNLAALLFNWGVITVAIGLIFLCHHHPLVILPALFIVGARQHALLILMHEASHYNLAPTKKLNNWLSDLFCAWPHLVTTASYRLDHLQHHRMTNDPGADPNLREKFGRPDWQFPMSAGKLFFIFLKDLTYGGPWRILKILINYFNNSRKKVTRGEQKVALESRRTQTLRLCYYMTIAAIFIALKLPGLLILYWLLPIFTVLPALLRLRILSEHHALPMASGGLKDDYNQSRHYAYGGFIQRFFIAPHQVANHLAHHLFPGVPWYRLPELHTQLMHDQHYRYGVNAGGGKSIWAQLVC